MHEEPASIGKSIVIDGELSGSEDLTIEGRVDGKIELRNHVLTIGSNGRITAQVDGRWDEYQGGSDGMFGFFETADDPAVAASVSTVSTAATGAAAAGSEGTANGVLVVVCGPISTRDRRERA